MRQISMIARLGYAVLAIALSHNVAYATDVYTSLPYMIHGSLGSAQLHGAFPLYLPKAKFQKSDGTLLPGSSLRFYDSYKNNLSFGMEDNLDHFDIWAGGPISQSGVLTTDKPVCEGRFLNDSGAEVTARQLSHMVVGDFDGSGQLSVFAIHTDASWYYVWKIGAAVGGSQSCVGNKDYKPIASGALMNASKQQITGNTLKFVLPTDWDNNNINEITAFPLSTQTALIWKITAGNTGKALATYASIPLGVNVNDVNAVVDNRASAGSLTSTYKNNPLGTELYLNTATSMQRIYQQKATPVLSNCQSNPNLCANTNLILSFDQIFQNGPVNAYGTGHQAPVSRLILQIEAIQNLLNPKGVTLNVLINPSHVDKKNLVALLNALNRHSIPFIFDMISSDTNSEQTTGNPIASHGVPKKALYGLSLDLNPTDPNDLNGLPYYISHYPNLKGYRIMEQLGMDQLHVLCQNWAQMSPIPAAYTNTCWQYQNSDPIHVALHAALSQPYRDADWVADVVGTPQKMGLILQAQRDKKFVIWSDVVEFDPYQFYWSNDYGAVYTLMEKERKAYIAYKQSLIKQYPGTVVPLYDNNEGTKLTSIPGYSGYQETPRNFRLSNWLQEQNYYPNATLGGGISNQSWTADSNIFWTDEYLPPEELASWTTTELNRPIPAKWVELEPLWYFFNWPRGDVWTPMQTAAANNSCTGLPTENLVTQLVLFGIPRGSVTTCKP